MKLHPLDISDIDILEDVFPFVNTDVVHNLELENTDYNIAASNNNVDAGHDLLWAFWHDNRLKLPFWYNVAKKIALIQSSSAFMERVFSIVRACLDERQETTCYSDRIRASALPKYNGGKKIHFFFCIRDALPCTAVLYTLVILRCGFSSLLFLNLVFQYHYCIGLARRVRQSRPTSACSSPYSG